MSFKGFRSYTRALLFLILLPGSRCLRNVSIIIPEAAERGNPVVFKCLYHLENEDSYQVKWYRGEKEFCRYTPTEVPPLKIFPIPGIEVDREGSDAKQLTISAATQRAQGRYTCEISTDAPSFTTVQLHGFMYVVDLPKYCPDLILKRRRYKPGMKIKAECICPDSMPPANLSFYINNQSARSEHVLQRVSSGENGALWTSYSTLQFVVQKRHIKNSKIQIRCTAMMYSMFHQSSTIAAYAVIIKTTMTPFIQALNTTVYPKHGVLENRSGSIRDVSIIVPEAAARGKPVVIKCLFILENQDLYQVKWYRGEKELCRYTPGEVPRLKIFPIPGLKVDLEGCGATKLTISAATQEAQGRYTCEISADAPSFTTVQLHGFMYVVDIPKEPYPDLISSSILYKPGMWLRAECISHDSMPPANLSFYINNQRARSEHVWERVSGGENGSLMTAYSTLQFVVQKHHIIDFRIKVLCIASVYSVYRHSHEMVARAEIITTTMTPPFTRAQRTTAYPKLRVLENSASWNRKILWSVILLAVTSIAYGQHSLG